MQEEEKAIALQEGTLQKTQKRLHSRERSLIDKERILSKVPMGAAHGRGDSGTS